MSKKVKFAGIVGMLLLLLAGSALAQGPQAWGQSAGGPGAGGPGAGGPGGDGAGMEMLNRFRMMFHNLDLSEAQQEEIQSIVETAREEVRSIMENSMTSGDHTPFMELFTSTTLTVADLEDNIGVMGEVREAAQEVIFQAIVDIHDVLTSEQLAELAEMAEQHRFGMDRPEREPGMRPMN